MLGSVLSSLCWCSDCQNEVSVLTEILDAVVKVEMIINKHLQAPNLKAGIGKESCRDELVILKESYTRFILIRAIKLLGWVKAAGECCLNDLIFSVFIKLLILHRTCVYVCMHVCIDV